MSSAPTDAAATSIDTTPHEGPADPGIRDQSFDPGLFRDIAGIRWDLAPQGYRPANKKKDPGYTGICRDIVGCAQGVGCAYASRHPRYPGVIPCYPGYKTFDRAQGGDPATTFH